MTNELDLQLGLCVERETIGGYLKRNAPPESEIGEA